MKKLITIGSIIAVLLFNTALKTCISIKYNGTADMIIAMLDRSKRIAKPQYIVAK